MGILAAFAWHITKLSEQLTQLALTNTIAGLKLSTKNHLF